MFGCLFSIFYHAIKNVSLIENTTCESVERAIRTFMFGCLFSIFYHAIKNVSLIENTDQTFCL